MKKLLVLLMLVSHIGLGQSLTLKDCLKIAIEKHPDYQEAILQGELAQNNIEQIKSSIRPEMSLDLFQSTNTGRSIDRFTNAFTNQLYNSTYMQAGLRQPVFQGFRLKHQVASAEYALESRKSGLEEARNRLSIQVIQAYLQVVLGQEQLRVSNKQIESRMEQLAVLQKRLDAGVLTKTSVLQVETQLASDKIALVQTENELTQSKVLLFTLLNQPFQAEATFLPLSSDSILDYDFIEITNQLPELEASMHRQAALEASFRAIKAENLPSLTFFANWNTFYASSNPEQNFLDQFNSTRNGSLSLGLSIPVFGRLQTGPRLQENRIALRLEQNVQKQISQNLQRDVNQTLAAFEMAKSGLDQAQRQMEISESLLKQLSNEVQNGNGEILELILAQNALFQAEIMGLRFKYSLLLHRCLLDFYATGTWDSL